MRKRPTRPGHLTTSEAAALLDVSVATLKRWSEAGLFGPQRTKGGHRRFSRAELEAFLHRPKAGEERGSERADELLGAVFAVEVEAFLLRSRAASGSWAEVGDGLRPALIELHRRRRDARITVVEWLSALDRLRAALSRVAATSVPPRGAPRLLVLSVPGDRLQHGAALTVLVGAEAGWAPVHGGAPWPRELAPELARSRPAAILATASVDADPGALARLGPELVQVAVTAGVPLGLGGLGEWTEPSPGAARLRTHGEVRTWLEGVADRGAGPAPGRAPPALERLEWSPALSLGDETLDAQHQVLFRSARTFLESARAGAAVADVERLLRFVEDYAQVHFRFEENLMRAHGYPHLEEHVWEHEQFIRRLRAERPAALAGSPEATRALAEVLRAWLVQHVGGSDQRIGAHLRAQRGQTAG